MNAQTEAFFLGARSSINNINRGMVYISWHVMNQDEFHHMARSLGVTI